MVFILPETQFYISPNHDYFVSLNEKKSDQRESNNLFESSQFRIGYVHLHLNLLSVVIFLSLSECVSTLDYF